jgi:hypothetical protein
MEKTFIKVVQTYQPKNKLQNAILSTLKEDDGTLLQHKRLETFINEQKKLVADFNEKFPRCKPERLHTYNYEDDTRIYIDGLIIISAYTVKIES